MIQHIFKIIWKERKTNFWIFLELVIIFSILWFCSDYLVFMCRRYVKPVGFNIENTYRLNFLVDEEKMEDIIKETGKERDEVIAECGWTILERVKRNSTLENVAISHMIYPYHGGNMSRMVYINGDTTKAEALYYFGYVSPEYFDLFRIPIKRGREFTWEDSGSKQVILDTDDKGYFGKYPIEDIQFVSGTLYKMPGGREDESNDLLGVAGKVKRDPFYPYQTHGYLLFPRELMSDIASPYSSTPIFIRVKPELDSNDFYDKFVDEMYEQLKVEPLYLSAVTPFKEVEEDYMSWQSYNGNFKSIGAIGGFLLVNIFLGLIGTFWFRTRERRSEIGLRMAIGSSKKDIRNIFIGETLFLVFWASIIGIVVSINIGMADILKEMGVPIPRREEALDWIQYIFNFSITFFILVIVSSLAVWYPANQASKTQPAIALRDE